MYISRATFKILWERPSVVIGFATDFEVRAIVGLKQYPNLRIVGSETLGLRRTTFILPDDTAFSPLGGTVQTLFDKVKTFGTDNISADDLKTWVILDGEIGGTGGDTVEELRAYTLGTERFSDDLDFVLRADIVRFLSPARITEMEQALRQ